MQNEQPVSNREFARLVGQCEGAVRKAIARQSIKDGLITVDGKQKIIPSVAALEWGKVILPQPGDEPEPVAEIIDLKPEPSPLPAADPEPVAEIGEADVFDAPVIDIDELEEDAELKKKIPTGITKAEADRRLSVLKARKAQIELDELEGRLVDKQLVFQSLAEMGIVIRDTFMNLPSRHLDEIIAADSRNERMILFENAIANALKSLVSLDNPVIERK